MGLRACNINGADGKFSTVRTNPKISDLGSIHDLHLRSFTPHFFNTLLIELNFGPFAYLLMNPLTFKAMPKVND